MAAPAGAGYAAGAPPGPRVDLVLTFADPAITEASGLVVRDGRFVTVNDSGDTARVFTVDADGATVGVTTYAGAPVDVEALAPAGPGEVWVGDIGDNPASRGSVSVTRVPFGPGARSVDATTYELVLPGGAADAETLLAEPRSGRLLVATKGLFGGRLLAAPRRLDPERPNRLGEIGTVLGVATDGAFWPDGRHLVVRSYDRAVVYTWPGLRSVGGFDLPRQRQGEGVAVDEDGEVYLAGEGVRSRVLRVALPRALARAVAPEPERTTTSSPPAPSASGVTDTTDTAGSGASGEPDPPAWPWLAGGLAGLVALGVLAARSRTRRRPPG